MSINGFEVGVDIKSKLMLLESHPKGYNLDKMLEFLSTKNSVFLFYFVGIDVVDGKELIRTALIPLFQKDLLASTYHSQVLAGRDRRGSALFSGDSIHDLLINPSVDIKSGTAKSYLRKILAIK